MSRWNRNGTKRLVFAIVAGLAAGIAVVQPTGNALADNNGHGNGKQPDMTPQPNASGSAATFSTTGFIDTGSPFSRASVPTVEAAPVVIRKAKAGRLHRME